MKIQHRKSEHLRIVSEEDVEHSGTTLLECVKLIHQALPEIDLDDINLESQFFGKKLKAPLMITSMTGGAELAGDMNRAMAEIASDYGIAFAVGSQRVMIEHPEVKSDFAVRRWIPDGVLLGNIGAVQLEEYPPEIIENLIEDIEADGICIHLNPAQEIVQDEGHRRFRGLLDKIAFFVDKLDGKVLVKETGAGLSPEVLNKLNKIGVSYIDISGAGGTSWTKVEKYRASDYRLRRSGETFSDWGIPTAFSLIAARKIFGEKGCIISSGGIYTGLDAARSIAAGADIAGFARSVLMPFLEGGIEKAIEFIECLIHELKVSMLLTGATDATKLHNIPRIYTGELLQWLEAYGWTDKKDL
ncbi:MAG: type 2 isopentenyl-diphosphate Delta-isomerase [candidate division Zixibacteria bacterium]|nr:type 2 isopentenyl-diphosphate Delta-isomerase [candidate division Zixibacteria bacterium]